MHAPAAPNPAPPHRLVIKAGQTEKHYWQDLWRYRELFQVLAWRDVSVRYKQTSIGLAWALIRPFLTMVVFTVIFGRVAKLPSDGTAPYALMVFAGLLPWQFFAAALSDANSLIANANLIGKVYFPRLIVPTATVVVAFIDFLVSFVILIGMMVWYQFVPNGRSCSYRSLSGSRFCHSRTGALDYIVEREIPRLSLRHSVPRPVRTLCLPSGLQRQRDSGRVEAAIQPEPDGWRHRLGDMLSNEPLGKAE
jgi:hypothetical protein